jgi:hypothetical protein
MACAVPTAARRPGRGARSPSAETRLPRPRGGVSAPHPSRRVFLLVPGPLVSACTSRCSTPRRGGPPPSGASCSSTTSSEPTLAFAGSRPASAFFGRRHERHQRLGRTELAPPLRFLEHPPGPVARFRELGKPHAVPAARRACRRVASARRPPVMWADGRSPVAPVGSGQLDRVVPPVEGLQNPEVPRFALRKVGPLVRPKNAAAFLLRRLLWLWH